MTFKANDLGMCCALSSFGVTLIPTIRVAVAKSFAELERAVTNKAVRLLKTS